MLLLLIVIVAFLVLGETMYKIGDILFDTKKNKIRVIEILERWETIYYKVINLEENKVYKLSEIQIRGIYSEFYNKSYIKYVINLARIKNQVSQGFLGSKESNIIPLPHQLYALNRAISNENIRYILADEVGLGKTIEAGLIIKELKARGLVKRILIVSPTGLITQWNIEMKEKFNEIFQVVLPNDYESIKNITGNEDIYSQFNQVISPMDSIKPLEKRVGWSKEQIDRYNKDRIESITNGKWDLIIIDEAHRVAGSSSEVSRYKLGELLSNSSPYLLLLTATPHSGKTEPFLRLIRLLDKKAFPNVKAIVKEQVSQYVIRSEKRETIDNNGNKLFKERETKIIEIVWDERHAMQRELYELVTNYVKEGYNKAIKEKKFHIGFLMILMQRLVTSSTAAIKESLEKRLEILELEEIKTRAVSMTDMNLDKELIEILEGASFNVKKELIELKKIFSIAKQAEFEYLDAKAEVLRNLLDDLYFDSKNTKVIIFTEFVATQNFLKSYLENRNYKISVLNGGMDIKARNIVLKEFETISDILISTDAGGEGINLQFSNIVINYDLPWNPMKIEQRIGRVDRIGQQEDVKVFNFIVKDTIENRVRNILEKKLAVILSETGVDKVSDILDNESAELDFTSMYLDSIKSPRNIEINTRRIEKELKTQITLSNKYKDIIKSDKDLGLNIYDDVSFDVNLYIKNMLQSYDEWSGKEKFAEIDINIGSPIVKKHLEKEIEILSCEEIPYIIIEDLPNEEGYFMLWEVNINDAQQFRRILPIFINKSMVVRPVAGKKYGIPC